MTRLLKIKTSFISLLAFPALLLLMAGCSDPDKKPLEGHRLSVLESEVLLRTDPEAGKISITLPSSTEVESWEQPACRPDHQQPHSQHALKGTLSWRESIGSGNSSDRALVSAPVSDGAFVYTMDSRGTVHCFTLEEGDRKWTYEPSSDAHNHIGGGLALHQGALYASHPDGSILKLNPENGEVLWETKLPEIIRTGPVVYQNHLLVLTTHNKLLCLDTKTGELIWTHTAMEESLSFVGGAVPALNDKIVVAPYSSGEVYGLYPANGLELWSDVALSFKSLDSKSIIGQFLAQPVLYDDTAYIISHGDLCTAIDIKTGERIWQKPFGGLQTPYVGENFIFLITSNNDLVCLTRSTGRVIWVHALPMFEKEQKKKKRILWYGPVLTSGRLMIVSSKGDVTFLSPQDGQILETLNLDQKFMFAPVLVKNKALLLSADGQLTVIE